MALVLAVPLMGQQAYATDAPNFFTWSASRDDSAYWNAISGNTEWWGASREDLTQLYGTYTDTLESDTGTDTLGNNGTYEYTRFYYEFESEPWTVANDANYTNIELSLNVGDINPVATGSLTRTSNVATGWASLKLESSKAVTKFQPPVAGKVRLGSQWVATGAPVYSCSEPLNIAEENAWINAVTSYQYPPGTRTWKYSQSIIDNEQSGNPNVGADVWVYMDYAPNDGVSALTTVNVTEESRAGSIQGTTTTSSGTTYYDYSVVNNNTYTSPLTGEEKAISEWQYDYVERQYNLVCEDGSEVKVVYGDENMTVQEGDTIETVYYGDSNGSDSGGDSEGGFGQIIADSLSAIGEFIAGLIAGILSIVSSAVEALGGLLDIFNGILDTIKGFFGGFTDFLASLFPFLPEETFDILNFGLILFIASAVIRKMFF